MVTRLEIASVRTIVREFDGAAFVVFHPLSSVDGGLMKTEGFH